MTKLLLLLAMVMLGGAAGAQQEEASAPVRVGRLTYFVGAVQVERPDNTGVDEPALNMPVAEGTRLVCGDYGQAEVEFEDGSLLRVTPRSAVVVDVLGLEGGVARTEMTVLNGLVYFELRKSAGYSYRVNAGGVVAAPLENTGLRVSLGDGPAVFSVQSGSVRIEHGFAAEVHAGESLHADPKDDTRYFLSDQSAVETWDAWNDERDRSAADETEKRTAARDGFAGVQGYGWSDLDANGTWYNVPDAGLVWQPNAADEEFDPYGYGHWVWQGAGYVWASGYVWGWTPFRCGHWEFYTAFGWGWVPDQNCGGWGSGGGIVLVGTHRPPHYKPIVRPSPPPVRSRPPIVVRGPNGPRPPIHWGGVQQVRGVTWTPLVQTGGVARTGTGLGLSRDYPVNTATHMPVTGKAPVTQAPVVGALPGVAPGWRPVAAEPVAAGAHAGARVTQYPARSGAQPIHTWVPVPVPVPSSVPVPAPGQPAAQAPGRVVAPPVNRSLPPVVPVKASPPAAAAPVKAADKADAAKPK